jgi:hypothetical protein
MRRSLAALFIFAAPSFALAQTMSGPLDTTAKGAPHVAAPPADKPADGQPAQPKAGELVNNPPYAHWSQFKPGASVTVKEVDTLADGSASEIVITSKLLSKSKSKVRVETIVTVAGAGNSSSAVERTQTVEDYPAKIRYEQSQSPNTAGYAVTEGKESVTFKGKAVDAEWVEATATNGDETTVEKVWTARDVPGGVVKETMTKTRGAQVVRSSTELVDYHAKLESKKAP